MLTLTGTIRVAQEVGGGINRKTGEKIPLRSVLQVEHLDNRGLLVMTSLNVPDLRSYAGRIGEQVSVPVRAWAAGSIVQFAYAEEAR